MTVIISDAIHITAESARSTMVNGSGSQSMRWKRYSINPNAAIADMPMHIVKRMKNNLLIFPDIPNPDIV